MEEYLARYGSHRRRWPSPENDAERPEVEWGFERALGDDVERLACERGYRVRHIRFEGPEHLSPLVVPGAPDGLQPSPGWLFRRECPRDFATFIRYHTELKGKIPARYPLTRPLAFSRLDGFLEEAGDRYPVELAS